MAKNKQCPMNFNDYEENECIRAKCAWWNDNPSFDLCCCAIKSIAIQFENIAVDIRMERIKKAREKHND